MGRRLSPNKCSFQKFPTQVSTLTWTICSNLFFISLPLTSQHYFLQPVSLSRVVSMGSNSIEREDIKSTSGPLQMNYPYLGLRKLMTPGSLSTSAKTVLLTTRLERKSSDSLRSRSPAILFLVIHIYCMYIKLMIVICRHDIWAIESTAWCVEGRAGCGITHPG